MATDTAPDEKVHIHEEKIERLEHTIDSLKKAIEDLQRSQDEKLQHFEGRFQRLEGMHTGSTSMKQSKEIRGKIFFVHLQATFTSLTNRVVMLLNL